MAHRTGFPSRGRTAKRQSIWLEFAPAVFTIAAASTPLLIFTLNASALALRPFTVVRTRGSLFYKSDQELADERYGCGFGIAVVSDQAAAIGVTAVPNPTSDYGSDLWFVIEQLQGFFQFGTNVGKDEAGRIKDLDSKAMRKVDVGQDIVVVIETSASQVSCTLESAFRMLVKVH